MYGSRKVTGTHVLLNDTVPARKIKLLGLSAGAIKRTPAVERNG